MNPFESELEELRARVARLEGEMAALRETAVPVARAAAVPRAPATSSPARMAPLAGVPPVLSMTPASPGLPDRLRELPSTMWIAGAGAVIFLIGAVYGLTVAIQRGWFSPAMRVGAGLVIGLAAGSWAARLLMRSQRALGVTLLAVGAGTWTFSLYFGAKSAALFPLGIGFAGAALATLIAGIVAARGRSQGALAVAIATGLAAPLVFSDGSGALSALLSYLLALTGAHLAAVYFTGQGSDWKWSRGVGVAGTWLVALAGAMDARLQNAVADLALLGGLGVVMLVLSWLPGHRKPATGKSAGSVVSLVMLAVAAWFVWNRADWDEESFAVVLLVLAGMSAGLLGLSRRAGDADDEQVYFLLGIGFAVVAVPVAFDWHWVSMAWGVGACLLAWRARRQESTAGVLPLRLVAALVAGASSIVWAVQALVQRKDENIFLNPTFAGAMFASAAWTLLARAPGRGRNLAFAAMQGVFVNALAWEFSRAIPSVEGLSVPLAVGMLLATFVYAAAGAVQWLRGAIYERNGSKAKAYRVAGYGWLAVAAIKLLVHDLGDRDLVFRAVAALGVGTMFIAAAFWADRHRVRSEPPVMDNDRTGSPG